MSKLSNCVKGNPVPKITWPNSICDLCKKKVSSDKQRRRESQTDKVLTPKHSSQQEGAAQLMDGLISGG